MEDWRLEITLYNGEILEFKFDTLDKCYQFTKQFIKYYIYFDNVMYIKVINNCNFVEINIDKYDIDNYRFEI